jgi:mono/diheme cytochrome c family protein
MNSWRSTVGAVFFGVVVAAAAARISVFGATGNTPSVHAITPDTPSVSIADGHEAVRGKELYTNHCSACHQGDGQGVAGTFPPLKGSGVVNKDDATKQVHIVLEGLRGAKAGGVVYLSTMPPFGDALSDANIADVVNYVRGTWGNHGKPVTAAQVAAARAVTH